MSELGTPVLFIIFNRPDLTLITFSQIREVRPEKLFIAADGPREDVPEDIEKCKKTRDAVLSMIDWDCELRTLFRDKNLGCGRAVSGAINWFFDHVEEGIILEDDCLPIPFFFNFSSEMLDKYRNHDRIMHISGNNFLTDIKTPHDIMFSNYTHSWGWATWKKSWELYDFNLTGLEVAFSQDRFKFLDKYSSSYWLNTFRSTRDGVIDTWDFQWLFTVWKNNGLSVIPKLNLVTNIGFGNNSTHTSEEDKRFELIVTADFKLSGFPSQIEANQDFDNQFFKVFLKEKGEFSRILRKVKRWSNLQP